MRWFTRSILRAVLPSLPVTTAFPGVEADDGGIDRTKLSAGLREGRFNLKELEAIVHPARIADRGCLS